MQLQRHLDQAQLLLADRKFADAEAELKIAAQIDPTAAGVFLAQARMLGAQNDLKRALAALDTYDTVATTDPEFDAGEKLRTQLRYNLKKLKEASLQQVREYFSSQAFAKALDVATSGLGMDPEDPNFLYYSGVCAGILRRREQAQKLLTQYLDVSDALNADAEQRARSRALLPQLAKTPPKVEGQPHWFSGFAVKEDVFYCPASMMFRPKVAAIKAKRINVSFDWAGPRLKSVHSLWENRHSGFNAFSAIAGGVTAATGGVATVTTKGTDSDDRSFFFDYYPDFPQVLRISNERTVTSGGDMVSQVYSQPLGTSGAAATVKTTQSDVISQDEGSSTRSGKWSFITLFNNPRVDPELAAAATGQRITRGFAPNLYFHPFAWDDIYFFDFAYDDTGRVRYAWCTNPPRADLRKARYEFEWDGYQLKKIVQRADSNTGAAILYERTMTYVGNRLVSENISFGGKHAKIQYTYNKINNKLMEAVCDDDPALNSLSRHATFLD